jgi:hypothetical protein
MSGVAHRIALPAWVVCMAFVAISLVLNVVNQGGNAGLGAALGHDVIFALWGAAYASVGALIGARRPENPIGWILLAAGGVLAASSALFEYANYALEHTRSLPGGVWAIWTENTVAAAAPPLIALALLLFPDGRSELPTWIAYLPLAATIALFLGLGLDPGALDTQTRSTANPVGVNGFSNAITVVTGVGWVLLTLSLLAGATAIVVRLRRSSGTARQQLKWVAFAGAVLALTWVWWTLTYLPPLEHTPVVGASLVVVTITFCGIPVAIGIAILRYRLYAIDTLIRRTLAYSILIALLATLYLASVVVVDEVFRTTSGQSSAIAVTISTLAVAALFRPALTRIRRLVDRRFYRSAYDRERTLAAFTASLRQQIDLLVLEDELLGVVQHTLQPTHSSLWFRAPDERRRI